MNYKLISAIMFVLLLAVAGYLSYNSIKERYLLEGYNLGQSEVIGIISKTGNIPFYSNETGQLEVKSEYICSLAKRSCG